jgi:CheY-like chemotaxis protein
MLAKTSIGPFQATLDLPFRRNWTKGREKHSISGCPPTIIHSEEGWTAGRDRPWLILHIGLGGSMAKTLLLADDSVTIQKVVNISFASEDVTLVTVDNGDDAVERAKETRPDLILADVVMPGKNGYEVCEAIKADPDLRHIPVLLLTGTFEAFDEERATRIGAAGHVAKPFEAQTLVNQVNRLLAEAPPPVPAREAAPVAPPEAVTTPAPEAVDSGDSFDFFDDDLSEIAEPEPAPAAAEPVGFDDSDSAFAFGDEDLTPATPAASMPQEPRPPAVPEEATPPAMRQEPAPADIFEEATPPAMRQEPAPPAMPAEPAPPPMPSQDLDLGMAFEDAPPPDRTVAILPDDSGPIEALSAEPASPPPTQVPPTPFAGDLDDSGFGAASGEQVLVPESGPEDSFSPIDPSATSDDAFDFAFESESAEPDPITAEPALDGGLMSVEAEDLAQATVLDPNGAAGYDVSSSDLGPPLVSEPLGEDPAPADATQLMDASALLDEPVAAAELTSAGDLGADLAPAVFEPDDEAVAPAPAFETSMAPAPAEAARALPESSAASADSILAGIAPALREQVHDTLEKIVGEVVDRVEKIAWEVIPQLAETLIKEEIRRMKGESDD